VECLTEVRRIIQDHLFLQPMGTDWNRVREIDGLRESGHAAEALAALKLIRESALDAEDCSSILLYESHCYCDLGQFDKASEAATEAIGLLSPENPSRLYAEFSLACVHELEGRYGLAVKEFKTLLKNHAGQLSTTECVQFRRGVEFRLIASLIVLGHGLEPLAIADSLKKEDISAEQRAELAYREAGAHKLLGGQDQSVKLYEQAVSGPLERPLAARAHFHIGEVHYNRGEFSRALDEFKNAEKLAGGGNPDKELFTKWINHTTRTIANDKPPSD
jgi:tetratricopeptide (TPR) repeat protein